MLPLCCHHSSRVAATADTLPLPLHRCHHSCDAAVASSPQQPHCHGCLVATAVHCRAATAHRRRCVLQQPALLPQQPRCCHSSCNAAVALSPQQQRCRHSSRVTAVVSLLQQCVAATARCRRRVPQQPRCRRCIVATAAATLLSRRCCSVVATAASLPLRRHCCHQRRCAELAAAAAPANAAVTALHCNRCCAATAALLRCNCCAAPLQPLRCRSCRCTTALSATAAFDCCVLKPKLQAHFH